MRKWVWKQEATTDNLAEWPALSIVLEENIGEAVTFWKITVEVGSSAWNETFVKEDDAGHFLRGVSAGLLMSLRSQAFVASFPTSFNAIKWRGLLLRRPHD
jgi:hypothetical protein